MQLSSQERLRRCIEEHRCPNCYRKHDAPTRYCSDCLAARRIKYAPEAKLCVDCGGPLPDGAHPNRRRCDPCRAAHKAAYQKILQEHYYRDLPPDKKAKARKRLSDSAREYRDKKYSQYRDPRLQREYGCSFADVLALYQKQNGACGICHQPLPEPNTAKAQGKQIHLDHDHKTNRIRGLLCPACNMGLGHFHDDPTLLDSAASYLRLAKQNESGSR